jgi:hypothetical protein
MAVRISIAGEAQYAYNTTIGEILEAKRHGRVLMLQRLWKQIDGSFTEEKIVYVDAAHITSFFEEL